MRFTLEELSILHLSLNAGQAVAFDKRLDELYHKHNEDCVRCLGLSRGAFFQTEHGGQAVAEARQYQLKLFDLLGRVDRAYQKAVTK